MENEAIKLGDEIEDVTAKVRGILIGRVQYLDGSIYFIMQPPCDSDGNRVDTWEFKAAYAKRVGDGVHVTRSVPMGFRVGKESAG